MSVLSTIEYLFPPPRSMTLHSVGVDISDSSLKYVEFERIHSHDANLALKHWGDIDIPYGILERGNVHDVGKLTDALKEMKKQSGAEYVSVSLPEERAYLFETTVPKDMSRTEVRAALEFRLEENVPLSPRDAYFDYAAVGNDDTTGDLRVAVAVYAQSTIHNYYEACVQAGLVPLSFEIEAQAIARASVPRSAKGAYMIVDFGKTRMGMGIVHNGILMYTSTIDISGVQMSDIMRTVLGDVQEEELTKIKNTRGIIRTKENETVAQALETVVQNIVDELNVRMQYWHTRKIDKGEHQIQKIILCGGSANLLGLPEHLTRALSVPVELASVWQNAFSLETFIPPISRRHSYGYATAIGLALKGFIE